MFTQDQLEAIKAHARRLRQTAEVEYGFCGTDEQKEAAVSPRLDLAEELEQICQTAQQLQ